MKNKTENECLRKLNLNGWVAYHKGWPDFICERNGKIIAIEVKPYKRQSLKNSQIVVMNMLSKSGIECYKYTPDGGLQKWENIKNSERRKHNKLSKKKLEKYLENI